MSAFSGQTWWLVGASEGLGRELARKMSDQGAHMVLSARDAARLQSLAESLPGQATALALDVTSADSVAQAVQALPAIDGVIYCAGAYEPMRAQEWQPETAVKVAEVNFVGALRVLGHVVPAMARRGSGHVVVIGSLAGFRGLPGAIGYGASKAAAMHLVENMGLDLRGSGVRVQGINPGFIRSRLTEKNDFAMPMLMEPKAAADHVLRAMARGGLMTSFPRPFSWLFRLLPLLPDWIYLRMFRGKAKG